jgi:hypothetical protein
MTEPPSFDVVEVVGSGVSAPTSDPGPFISGFAAWMDAGHGVPRARPRHLHDVKEFLVWCDVNPQDDVVHAARHFGEFGSQQQARSMRLLLEWLADR